MDPKARTGITMAVLAAILLGMAYFGVQAATAPFPPLFSAKETKCKHLKVKKRLYRKEIQVSVYNASKRKGLAGSTLEDLEGIGFIAGEVGNAPEGAKTKKVQVWASSEDDPAALLVAQMFRPDAQIVVSPERLGPGTDVLVGKKYRGIKRKPVKSIKLAKPRTTCLD